MLRISDEKVELRKVINELTDNNNSLSIELNHQNLQLTSQLEAHTKTLDEKDEMINEHHRKLEQVTTKFEELKKHLALERKKEQGFRQVLEERRAEFNKVLVEHKMEASVELEKERARVREANEAHALELSQLRDKLGQDVNSMMTDIQASSEEKLAQLQSKISSLFLIYFLFMII